MTPSAASSRVPDRRPPHPRQTISRLDAEWRSLASRRTALAVARTWSFLGAAVLDDLRSLDQVLAATGFRPPPAADAVPAGTAAPASPTAASAAPTPTVAPASPTAPAAAPDGPAADPADTANALLSALVARARTDELAARVVLQRLLPGLSAVARRNGRCLGDHLQAFDDVLCAAWGVIRTFPVERRSRHVAAALLRDCEYVAFRRERRRLMVHEPTSTDELDRAVECDELVVEPMFEVVELIEVARDRHLAEGDVALLGLLLSGRQLRAVAADLAVSERTVRNHRDAVVHRLRAAITIAA